MHIPIKISKIPEIIDQIFFGSFIVEAIFFPKRPPSDKNINWKVATKTGNIIEFKPTILPPIPIPIESKESAIPKIYCLF